MKKEAPGKAGTQADEPTRGDLSYPFLDGKKDDPHRPHFVDRETFFILRFGR